MQVDRIFLLDFWVLMVPRWEWFRDFQGFLIFLFLLCFHWVRWTWGVRNDGRGMGWSVVVIHYISERGDGSSLSKGCHC
jgi:hypothetical protein